MREDTRRTPPNGLNGTIPAFNARAVRTKHSIWIECAPGKYWFRATQPKMLIFKPN